MKKSEGYKEKYEKEHKDFEDYKNDILKKQTEATKEKAVRSYFEGKDITGKNLEIAIRGASKEIDAIEMDGEKIKDTKALDDLVAGTFSALVVKSEKRGVETSNPPANNGGEPPKESRAKILEQRYHENLYGKEK